MNTFPPDLMSAFTGEDYDAALQLAEKLPAGMYEKVVCTIHVKTQDCEALDLFLASHPMAGLEFFRAYADYS